MLYVHSVSSRTYRTPVKWTPVTALTYRTPVKLTPVTVKSFKSSFLYLINGGGSGAVYGLPDILKHVTHFQITDWTLANGCLSEMGDE